MAHICQAQDGNNADFFTHVKKINEINKQAGGFNDLFLDFANPHLAYLGNLLHISPVGAAMFAGLVHLYRGGLIELFFLADYFNLNCIELMQYMEELEILAEKDLIFIHKNKSDFFDTVCTENFTFELRLTTIDMIGKGKYHDLLITQTLSIDKFFLQVERLCEDRVQRRQPYNKTLKAMRKLLLDNEHLVFVQKVQKLSLSDDDILVLLRFFHYTIMVDEPEMTFRHLVALYNHASDFVHIKRQLKSGQYVLITKGLIENTCSDGFSVAESFQLTDATKEEFLVELDLSILKTPVRGLIRADAIAQKQNCSIRKKPGRQ